MVAAYEKEAAPSQQMTPQPSGTDVVEAAFLWIRSEIAHGKSSVDDDIDQFFTEAEQTLGLLREGPQQSLDWLGVSWDFVVICGRGEAWAVGPRWAR